MKPFAGYLILALGITTGIAANSFAKISDGFSKLTPTIACLLLMTVTMFSLAKAMSVLPVAFSYSTYSGLTVAGVVLFGILKYNQVPNLYGFIGICLIVIGVVMVNYLGMIEKQLLIEDLNDKYILLKTDAQILDQVTITGSTELSDEVDTGYGKKKNKSIGFSTSTIKSEEISPSALTIVDAIRGKFTNVQVAYDQNGAATGNKQKVYVRGGSLSINNSAAAIFDVEGFIYSDVPDFIDPQQIESITLLRSLSATNKYGSQGRGGVFLVKMKWKLPT